MLTQEKFENIVKSMLHEKAEGMELSPDLAEKVRFQIETRRSEKNFMSEKKFFPIDFNLKKAVAVTVCSALVITGSVFTFSKELRVWAAENINRFVVGYETVKSYETAASGTQIQKDAGFAAKIPEILPGGYTLVHSNLAGQKEGIGADLKETGKKLIGVTYQKAGEEKPFSLGVSISKADSEFSARNGETVVNLGTMTAYWREVSFYVTTADGSKLSTKEMREGTGDAPLPTHIAPEKIYDAFTSDLQEAALSIHIAPEKMPAGEDGFKTVHTLKWRDQGIDYALSDLEGRMTLEEAMKIAEHIINTKVEESRALIR